MLITFSYAQTIGLAYSLTWRITFENSLPPLYTYKSKNNNCAFCRPCLSTTPNNIIGITAHAHSSICNCLQNPQENLSVI